MTMKNYNKNRKCEFYNKVARKKLNDIFDH